MDSTWEELSCKSIDVGLGSCNLSWDFDEVDATELSSLFHWFVMPVDSVEVKWVYIPKSDILERVLDALRNKVWVLHLSKGRESDSLFPTSCNVFCDYFRFLFKVNEHNYFSC